MLQFIAHVLGLDNPTGSWYLFWSGFGGDLSEIAIIGGIYSIYKARTCDIKGCHRISSTRVKGTEWSVCRKHAPNPRPTPEDLVQSFDEEVLPDDLPEEVDEQK